MPGFELFGNEEKKHLQDVMETGVLMRYNFDGVRNNHWKAKEFEEAIQEKMAINHVHLVSSGTTALITAIKALGIGAGDEIIMPTFTFVASFEAVLFAGAIPILVDIDETLTMSPSEIEKAISPKTKAIMPVHMCGAMADMDAIIEIAQKHSLFIIEDACQSIGASYKGKYLGTMGDIGCFSFDFVKTITCGEGGAILTNNKDLYSFCDQYSDHGHDHIGKDRGAESHPIIGLNFRISELHAAVGLGQWQKLDKILAQQREIKSYFKSLLAENKKIGFRKILDEKGDNASFLTLILSSESQAKITFETCKNAGIPCAYWYENNWHYVRKWDHLKALKSNETFSESFRNAIPDYAQQDFHRSDEIMKRTLTLPLSIKLDKERMNEMAEIILKTFS